MDRRAWWVLTDSQQPRAGETAGCHCRNPAVDFPLRAQGPQGNVGRAASRQPVSQPNLVGGGNQGDRRIRFSGGTALSFVGYLCQRDAKTAIGSLAAEEAISRVEALQLYTINAAHISFEEGLRGSIEAGKLADFVVLSDDLLTVPEETIKNIEVLVTVVGGKIVYEK